MPVLELDLRIDATEFLLRYKVPGAVVRARSRDGRQVVFPASILQPFITHAGIIGHFCIEFDSAGKFVRIRREAAL